MTKLDWDIAEHNRILDEMQHRTEVENQAFGLMAEGKFLEAKELVETLDDSLLEFQEWPGEESVDDESEKESERCEMTQENLENEAADCIAQHINTFLKQTRNEQIADFGQPCAECMHRNECKFDWLSKMQPVLQRSNVKINLVRKEH